jgi:hypothetical protein
MYFKGLNSHVGTTALNARKYVDSATKVNKKEYNEKNQGEEWSSYPSSIPNNCNTQIPMKTTCYTYYNK